MKVRWIFRAGWNLMNVYMENRCGQRRHAESRLLLRFADRHLQRIANTVAVTTQL
jgi:hypothetical protein